MLELGVGEFAGDLELGVMKPNDWPKMSLQLREPPLEGAFGVRAFRDVFEEFGLDLVAERLLDLQAALVVLVGIAEIADRADIDPAGLQLFLGLGRPRQAKTPPPSSPVRA